MDLKMQLRDSFADLKVAILQKDSSKNSKKVRYA